MQPCQTNRAPLQTWIKRTLIGAFGATMLFGGLAACSPHRQHGGNWHEADIRQQGARFISKASREPTLDEAQKAT